MVYLSTKSSTMCHQRFFYVDKNKLNNKIKFFYKNLNFSYKNIKIIHKTVKCSAYYLSVL